MADARLQVTFMSAIVPADVAVVLAAVLCRWLVFDGAIPCKAVMLC